MRFLDALQLGPAAVKAHLRNTDNPRQKRFFMLAITTKSILCVLSAIILITAFKSIFGAANSSAAVVIFCILVAVLFVDFDYRLSDSIVNLGICFSILALGPWLAAAAGPVGGFLINVLCLLCMVVMVGNVPMMGNAGLYSFAYVFLSGNPVHGQELLLRCAAMTAGFVLCAMVFVLRHRKKDYARSFRQVLRDFQIHSHVAAWQLRLALGVSVILMLTQLLGLPHFMWAGFACSSVLSPFEANVPRRAGQRVLGVALGSVLFWAVYAICPAWLHTLFGPLAGFLLGFCSTYHWNTVINCFGALLLAAEIYGVGGAVGLRIFNNLLGACFAFLFFYIFQWTHKRLFGRKGTAQAADTPTAAASDT